MPQDPVEVIREQYRATNDRDFQRAMAYYAEDVVLVVEEGFLNTGTFEGKEAVGEWFGDWFRAFASDYRFTIDEIRELEPGLVFLMATYGGTGRTSGAQVSDRRAYLYRVEDGKITQVQLFVTPESAIEAASLPEWSGAQTD
ncbi:MAG TPA: nuclear transport factor 2 family protein [Solirubrobacterales bacterium]|nr:nuclear transport factor 2 family protein [Solirubrobacterales bacterium]